MGKIVNCGIASRVVSLFHLAAQPRSMSSPRTPPTPPRDAKSGMLATVLLRKFLGISSFAFRSQPAAFLLQCVYGSRHKNLGLLFPLFSPGVKHANGITSCAHRKASYRRALDIGWFDCCFVLALLRQFRWKILPAAWAPASPKHVLLFHGVAWRTRGQ